MITLFSGIPGSGKTYKMVAELSRAKDKFYVVHNIDGLQEGYLGEFGVNFVDYCNGKNDLGVKMEVIDFLSKEYQIGYCEAIREKYDRSCLVIIDEAHEWFSSHSKTLRLWLSYHRHLGQEIWLVAHRSTNLPSVYRSFIEVEYRAKSSSFIGIPGRFGYSRILGGQRVGYVTEKKNKKIFALYKSQMIETEKKRKFPMFFPIIIIMVLIGAAFYILLPQWFMKKNVNKKVGQEVQAGVKIAEGSRPGGDVNKLGPVSQAGVVFPNVLPKVKKELSELYAFIGNFDGRVVLENRENGEQISISRVPGRLMLISANGSDSCDVIAGDSGKQMTFYNSTRFAGISGRSLRPEIPASGASMFPVMAP